MRRSLALLIGGTLAGVPLALAAAQGSGKWPAVVRADLPGRITFERQCAPCHGTGAGDDGTPMLPGTAALAAKYEGREPGALELRRNLPPAVIAYFVRHGSGAMPAFRKAELSDADVADIAAYLARTADLSFAAGS